MSQKSKTQKLMKKLPGVHAETKGKEEDYYSLFKK